ncbi:MAG TPA: hypothetical protein VGS20_13905 [Candidatus Acidoferrales bacterium]|nr:hypothetical protein [Candidatus Acidoferrales bacterium]
MAAEIVVRAVSDTEFEVTVREGASQSQHVVTVEAAYARKLDPGSANPENLLRRSFAFLLEREPKESILRRFDLRQIGRYFPDFEREIRARPGR